MIIKNWCILFLLFIAILTSGYVKPSISASYQIDASKNSVFHNAVGLRYLEERCYYAAVQEFKIAISLNPNSQSAAIAYNNLGRTYMLLGFATQAQDCFERAIKLYGLNFEYYKNLADCYTALKIDTQKIKEYEQAKDNPLNKVMLGLLYINSGNKRSGIIILDSFCMSEPDLIITGGVRAYLKQITEEMQQTQE
ncbi:MAG: tetratricopeptide repeat protein [Candidatus Gastranaerophilales bacterium]|nr:tetratricopeptide repeat protein [Candidatus Gastranaerophilales bacterium]